MSEEAVFCSYDWSETPRLARETGDPGLDGGASTIDAKDVAIRVQGNSPRNAIRNLVLLEANNLLSATRPPRAQLIGRLPVGVRGWGALIAAIA